MANDEKHLRVLIESMARNGCSENEIAHAVREAGGEAGSRVSHPAHTTPMRKGVSLGRWRVELVRL